MATTPLAVCGLGQMGEAMAGRLLDAGHELTVWNRTAAKAEPLARRGARVAATPAEAAAAADGVITTLADADALDAVVFGRDGIVAAGGSRTLIEMSTVGPEAVRRTAEHLPEGVHLLDAPVLGSVRQAKEGTLKVFVGGHEALVSRWTPVLEALGRVFPFGPLGSGAAMKLVANSTLGALMTGLAEALALADAFDLDEALVLDVLAESAIGATVKSKREHVESGEYPPNFKLSLAAKDLRLVTDAADRAGLTLRLAPAARAWLEQAEAAGLGDLDYSAVVAAARGREVARRLR